MTDRIAPWWMKELSFTETFDKLFALSMETDAIGVVMSEDKFWELERERQNTNELFERRINGIERLRIEAEQLLPELRKALEDALASAPRTKAPRHQVSVGRSRAC